MCGTPKVRQRMLTDATWGGSQITLILLRMEPQKAIPDDRPLRNISHYARPHLVIQNVI